MINQYGDLKDSMGVDAVSSRLHLSYSFIIYEMAIIIVVLKFENRGEDSKQLCLIILLFDNKINTCFKCLSQHLKQMMQGLIIWC